MADDIEKRVRQAIKNHLQMGDSKREAITKTAETFKDVSLDHIKSEAEKIYGGRKKKAEMEPGLAGGDILNKVSKGKEALGNIDHGDILSKGKEALENVDQGKLGGRLYRTKEKVKDTFGGKSELEENLDSMLEKQKGKEQQMVQDLQEEVKEKKEEEGEVTGEDIDEIVEEYREEEEEGGKLSGEPLRCPHCGNTSQEVEIEHLSKDNEYDYYCHYCGELWKAKSSIKITGGAFLSHSGIIVAIVASVAGLIPMLVFDPTLGFILIWLGITCLGLERAFK